MLEQNPGGIRIPVNENIFSQVISLEAGLDFENLEGKNRVYLHFLGKPLFKNI